MKRNIFYIALLILSLVTVQMSIVKGESSSLLDSYSETNYESHSKLNSIHPSVANGYNLGAVSQSFTTPNGTTYTLSSCKFYLKRLQNPVGNLKAILYASTGDVGDEKPTGSSLALSDSVNMSIISADNFELVEFTFSEAEQYEMAQDIIYCITVQVNDATTIGDTDAVYCGEDWYATHAGGMAYHENGAWASYGSEGDGAGDCLFYVYGEVVTEAVGIAAPYIYAAISLMSLSLIIGVGAALISSFEAQDMISLISVIIIGIGIMIVLFIVLPVLNAFSGL